MKRASTIALLGIALALPGTALAHLLDENTARITLRDGHVDIEARLDLIGLMGEVSTDTADVDWNTLLATATEEVLASTANDARALLESDTRLLVDGEAVGLKLRDFPAPLVIRAMAAQASATGKPAERFVVKFEAERALPGARQVEVVFPAKLGLVLTSFVQPQMHYARPGERVAFTVPGQARTDEKWRLLDVRAAVSVIALLLAAAAFALAWMRRRNN